MHDPADRRSRGAARCCARLACSRRRSWPQARSESTVAEADAARLAFDRAALGTAAQLLGRAEDARPDGRLRRRAPPVRRADRVVPGGEAPPGRRRPRPGVRPPRRCSGPPGRWPGDPTAPRDVSTAKAMASDAAELVGRQALQCHGAIGYTVEADLHLFLKRAWALARSWGDAAWHRGRVAAALGSDPGTRRPHRAHPWRPMAAVRLSASDRAPARGCGRSGGGNLTVHQKCPPSHTGATMPEAYIVDAVRTPVGRRGGGLAAGPPRRPRRPRRSSRSSSAPASTRGRSRTSCSAASTPIGGQAGDIARTCWLAAGLPDHVPGTTVDRQCGSSQQAMHFAAQAVMSGTSDLVVAGGVQQMSQIPIASAMLVAEPFGFADPFTRLEGWVERYGTQEVSQFRSARDDRREVGHHPRGHGGVRGRAPHPGDPGHRRGSLRGRDRAARRARRRRGPPRAELDKIRSLPHAHRGRPGHRRRAPARSPTPPPRCSSPASRRSHDHGLTPRARIHHLSVRGRRPDLDAHRADPGHPPRPRARRA